jgi:hypothetical protein
MRNEYMKVLQFRKCVAVLWHCSFLYLRTPKNEKRFRAVRAKNTTLLHERYVQLHILLHTQLNNLHTYRNNEK